MDDAVTLDDLVDMIVRLAAGDIGARIAKNRGDDSLVAIAAGLNMLAEELQALQDVRERGEAALREAAARAQEASRLKSEFVATVSHELRTPMNGVIGMTSLLLKTPLTAEQREYADVIRSSAHSLLAVLNDILDFSQVEAGKVTLEFADFDVRALVEDVVDLASDQAATKGVVLVGIVGTDVPMIVHSDAGRLRQILVNLVHNAVKFTARGHVAARVHVDGATEDGWLLRIDVEDTGIGIPPDAQRHIFDSFRQADATITRRFGGTGLGLTISAHLARLLGGSITLRSEPGEGSTFSVVLPVGRPHSVPPPALLPPQLTACRALVVDPHHLSTEKVVNDLRWLGVPVDSAPTGNRALQMLRAAAGEAPYPVVLVDGETRDMTPTAFADAVRRTPATGDVRVVLVGAAAMRGSVHVGGGAFDAFLFKPIRASNLLAALTNAVAGSRRAHRPAALSVRAASARRARALVVEDNHTNARVTVRMLERLQYRADVVGNGREAVAAVARARYDVVIMDCEMPEMDGFEATRQIRAAEPPGHRIPIVAMTAAAMRGDAERCLAAGMDAYLPKPVELHELAGALARFAGPWPPAAAADRVMSTPEAEQIGAARRAALMDLYRGEDPGELATLITQFETESAQRLAAIEAAVAARDYSLVRVLAHEQRGSARMMGAESFGSVCSAIEDAANDRDSGSLAELLGQARAALSHAAAQLGQMREDAT